MYRQNVITKGIRCDSSLKPKFMTDACDAVFLHVHLVSTCQNKKKTPSTYMYTLINESMNVILFYCKQNKQKHQYYCSSITTAITATTAFITATTAFITTAAVVHNCFDS